MHLNQLLRDHHHHATAVDIAVAVVGWIYSEYVRWRIRMVQENVLLMWKRRMLLLLRRLRGKLVSENTVGTSNRAVTTHETGSSSRNKGAVATYQRWQADIAAVVVVRNRSNALVLIIVLRIRVVVVVHPLNLQFD